MARSGQLQGRLASGRTAAHHQHPFIPLYLRPRGQLGHFSPHTGRHHTGDRLFHPELVITSLAAGGAGQDILQPVLQDLLGKVTVADQLLPEGHKVRLPLSHRRVRQVRVQPLYRDHRYAHHLLDPLRKVEPGAPWLTGGVIVKAQLRIPHAPGNVQRVRPGLLQLLS